MVGSFASCFGFTYCLFPFSEMIWPVLAFVTSPASVSCILIPLTFVWCCWSKDTLPINLHFVMPFLQLHDYVQWKVKPRSVHTNISLNINHNGDLKRFFVWLDDVNYHKENSLAPNLLHTVQKHLDVHVEDGYNVQFYELAHAHPLHRMWRLSSLWLTLDCMQTWALKKANVTLTKIENMNWP